MMLIVWMIAQTCCLISNIDKEELKNGVTKEEVLDRARKFNAINVIALLCLLGSQIALFVFS